MDSNIHSKKKDIVKEYSDFMSGYIPSPYVNKEWPMEDGMYLQYSGWDNTEIGVTGTIHNLSCI